ncbi:hypothetical protein [Brevibacterium aurantiacum]|uniref:Uncharacterized protein n=1 Tax=Brevibacterium aurantiacum TaxID=273384 RepID=A0A2A3YTQ8_BREAU|nr:hypothetical protein [Brevibacterium aurantiacum]PCC43162.1 hypothetical protein CIK65_07635 [Brevibacterium aurantiacum]
MRSRTDVLVRRPAQETAGLPAHFAASSFASESIDAGASVLANLGEPYIDKGGNDLDNSGDAVPVYLDLPLTILLDYHSEKDRRADS